MRQISDLDIKLLKVFVAIVESGGFAAAQARLNSAPSTLSEQIKDLEFRAGFTVCLRGRRGFKLTKQGEQLYDAAVELFDTLELFKNKVAVIGGRNSGQLAVGLVDSMVTSPHMPMSAVIRRFEKAMPDVRVNLIVEPPPELEIAVLEGRVDLAIGPYPGERKGIDYLSLYRERETLFCGPGNELFARAPANISDADLATATFVACGYPSQADTSRFRPIMFVHNMEALLMLLLSGGYVGYLPTHLARSWVEKDSLRPILPDSHSFDARFYVLTKKVVVQDPVRKAFMKAVVDVCKEKAAQLEQLGA